MSEQLPITIVPFADQYAAEVRRISVEAWRPIYNSYRELLGDELFEAQYGGWEERKPNNCERNLREDHGFVALSEGRVVGFIAYIDDSKGKTGTIGNNAVDPALRGNGIAPRLYAFVLEEMRRAGYTYAKVDTGLDDAHAPARHAYAKAGFEHGIPSVLYYQKL